MTQPGDITLLLEQVHEGEDGALDALMERVYADLQRVAERHMADRFGHGLPGVTLEPAALVNESFMKLILQRKKIDNHEQFFALATRIMLRVLIDYQRRRLALRRGGGARRVTLSFADPTARVRDEADIIDVEALAEALEKLQDVDQRKADVVKLRVVWGLEMKDIATALDISLATVERDWAFAKAWLGREIADESAGAGQPDR